MSKGAQQSGSTTQTNTTPSYMYPYLGTGLNQAASLLQQGGPQVYPGQRVASFNPAQQQAMGGTIGLDQNLMQGNGNPYENAMFQQAAGGVGSALQGQFAGSGRDIAGSMPLAQQGENQLATDFYGQNYQNTINNAMNAANQNMGIGNQIQNQSQNQINASMDAFNQNQMRPYQNLQQYFSFLNGSMPGSQQTTPFYTNQGANLLGTALAGQQLYNGYQNKGSSGGSGSQFASSGPGSQQF